MLTAASKPRTRFIGSRQVKLAAGLVVSAAFLYATFRTIPLDRVIETLGRADPAWIAAALVAVAVAYTFKIYRWVVMLRSLGSSVRFRDAAVPFLGGVALNNVLPFRAGDVIRVVAFQRFTAIPASGQVGTLVLERLLDLLVLMTILVAAASLASTSALDEGLVSGLKVAALALAAAIAVFLAVPRCTRWIVGVLIAKVPRARAVGDALIRLSDAVAVLTRPRLLAGLTGLSVLAWLSEGAAYWAVGRATGAASDAGVALLALSVGTLSTIIPSSPGYVGTFHYFTTRVVTQFGASAVDGAAFAVLIHAVLWLSTTVTGFLLLAASGMKQDGRTEIGRNTSGHP